MATIKSAIALYDGVTGPLQSMHKAMNIVISSFETMQDTSGNAVDVTAIQQAREELGKAGAAFDEIENEIRQADQAQQQFNRHLGDASPAADALGDTPAGSRSASPPARRRRQTPGASRSGPPQPPPVLAPIITSAIPMRMNRIFLWRIPPAEARPLPRDF